MPFFWAAVDVVGIEVQPHTVADQIKINSAKTRLRDFSHILSFPEAAGCKVKFAEVDFETSRQDGSPEKRHETVP